ncbi:outer membrane lipoprotein carrier protein LolA [Sphingomonas ginkgonis]|uniref:Outer membrane lipoprotein carrier protein LolA n=1 Tax=Sphingomonas ginkgonis TaxID=2315330 RepID=A0A3R9WNL8_9SPHN|nr:outer membrane lipoprotein carrier protein LolA [Sphingomonas ginkgonis]RST29741.1 outer membrane lipoprotein carrier protein LolA [Sphingomonas ginkgonis]
MISTRTLARALAPVAVFAAASPAAAAPSPALAQVQQSLAATQSMTAAFRQTDGKGQTLAGTLALKRPGKIRFAYGGGADALLVSDGATLHYLDYDVGQHSKWPIGKSPLAILLATNPDLARIATILPSDSRVVLVRARDARRPEFGTLVLAFSKSAGAPGGLLLEGWSAIDAQNKRTTVKLDNQRYNVAVPESAFSFTEPKKR